jgi:glycosyltransferase involved in cell wall biosynthesis
VVTHYTDERTKAICNKYSIDYVETNCFYEYGNKFNKGRAINLGLAHLEGSDWLLHLDADVYLPHRFRDLLARAQLNQKNLYGADRINVYGADKWDELKEKISPHYSDKYFVEPTAGHPVGARIIHAEHGYSVIGYFQLWHKSMGKKYPIHQGTAEHTDVLFSCQWTREQRVLLPEVLVYHLESSTEPQKMGQNWNGRTTPEFRHRHHHHRHHHHKHHGYCEDKK